MFCLVAPQPVLDYVRLLFTKGTQWVCGGVEEIGVGFHQWCVAGSQARQRTASARLLVAVQSLDQENALSVVDP